MSHWSHCSENLCKNQRDFHYLKVKLCIARFSSLEEDETGRLKTGIQTFGRQTEACVSC